jgi:hypothetical protein
VENAPRIEPPSFRPMLGRVRMAKTLGAILGFVFVTALSRATGLEWYDATVRGLGAAVAFFFVSWASALWICSELHAAHIRKLKRQIHEHNEARERQIREIYEQRISQMGGETEFMPPAQQQRPAA